MLNNDAISLLFLFSNLYKYDIFNIYNILKKTKSGEKMVTIGIVEDQKEDKEKITAFIDQYKKENNEQIVLKYYDNGNIFIEKYKSDCDIIFMDIDMPVLNGFDASVELRKKDKNVVLIFITNLNQYAINGYSVSAFDFVVKPINYYSFSTMLKRAITKANYEKNGEVVINSQGNIFKLDIKSITYIEVNDHQLVYHTDSGDYNVWGSLSSIKDEYIKNGFASGGYSCLINLRRVLSLNGDVVTINDEKHTTLYLTRNYRKSFAQLLVEYISGDGN